MISAQANVLVVNELRTRTPMRGMRKQLAYDLGTNESNLSAVMLGKRMAPEVLAWRLLAKIRQEDLALADRIEAELLRPSMLKERDW